MPAIKISSSALSLKAMKTLHCLFIIFLIGTITGCKNPRVINEYRAIPENGWSKDLKVKFHFLVNDTQLYHNLHLNLRITGDYPFRKIYVVVHVLGPGESHSKELVGLTLAEPDGKWLGSGMGDIISFQLPLLKNMVFRKQGKYVVEIEQYMRADVLPFVRDVGLMVETGEEII